MARYEKTIAGHDFVWNITIPTVPTSVYSLLPASGKTALDCLVPHLNIVDGYVVSYTNNFNVTRGHADAGTELVISYQQYTCPYENWPVTVLVWATSPVTATVRVFTA